MIRWKNIFFPCFKFWLYAHLAQKKKDSQCFSSMCGVLSVVLAELMPVGKCMSAVCHSLTCPTYTHCFVLNSLKQLVLNLVKATTEWEHGLAYVLWGKHYSFYIHGYLLVWGPSCVIVSLSHFCQNSFQFQIRMKVERSEWAQLILSWLLCFDTSFTSLTNSRNEIT